jgi:hypothetical protein
MSVTEGDYPKTAAAGDSAPRRANKSSEIRISVSDLKDYVEDWNIES